MKLNRYTYLLLLLISTACTMQSMAQGICVSSALAPVFKQTFGTSTSSTKKNTVPTGFLTNYAFNGSTTLADGQYMVTPLVQNSQKNDWAVGGDHTGDVNGNMFLVNAGTGASLFFKQQVDNLCPGSTYSFSAWLVNVNTTSNTVPICNASYVYPNVTFYIKNTAGTILQSFNTGNIPFTTNRTVAPNWRQYGFQFALPAGTTSLVLEMADFYGGQPQCGNDLAIDDIVFSACTPQAAISFNTGNSLCAGSNTVMSSSLTNSPFGNPAYQWQKSTDGGISWTNIGAPGTSATNFPLNNITAADGAQYRALVGPDVSSLTSNTCVTASNVLALTVNPLPVANINANNPVCAGSTLNLNSVISNGTSPYSVKWTGPGLSSTLANITIPNVSVAANAGMYTLSVTDANLCSATISTTIIVNDIPSTANAGTDQSLCTSSTANLIAVTPVTGSGVWTETSGPSTATIVNPSQSNTVINGLVAGTYKFVWTVSSGVCTSSADEVLITVNTPTTPGILLSSVAVCANTNQGTLTLTGYTGNIKQWESSIDGGITWVVIANTSNNDSYQNLAVSTRFRVLVQNNTCPAAYSNTVIVSVNPPTVAGIISANATVCAGVNSGTLSLTGNTGAVLQWERSVDNGASWQAIANTANVNSYSNLSVTTLYRALVQSGNCVAQYTNTVTITVIPSTVPGLLSANATVCFGTNSGTLTLAGNTGAVVRWESSVDNGSSWQNIADTVNTYQYSNLIATTIYRVLVQNNNCGVGYSNTITIMVNPAANAGILSGNISVCAGANSGTLSLTGYTGNITQWESSTDNGVSWNVIADTLNTYSYNNIAVTTQFRVLVKNGNCNSNYSNTVTITVSNNVVAGILSADAVVCASANSGTLSLTGYSGSIVQWESSIDNGGSWSVITDTLNIYSYNNIAVTTQFRVLVKNGNCVSKYSNAVTITVSNNVVAGILLSDAVVCASANSGTLSLTGYSGNISQWESSINNGGLWNVITDTLNIYSYNNIAVTTRFRVLVKNGNCVSKYSNAVTITVSNNVVAGILSADVVVCASANSGILSLTGYSGSIVQWESSIDNGGSWGVIADTLNNYSYNNIAVTTQFRVLVKNGNCVSKYSNTVTITVSNNAVAGILSADAVVCASENSGTLSLTGYSGNIARWESSTDNGSSWTVIADTLNNYSYNNIAVTTQFRVLVKNGNCASKYSNTVTITVSNNAVAGTLSADAVVCASANSGTLSLTGYTGNITEWKSSIDNGSSWTVIVDTLNTYSYNNIAATTQFRVLVKNGNCVSKYSNAVTITVSNNVVPGILSADAVVCASANSGTLSLTGYTGNITQWESSTDNGVSWIVIVDTLNTYSYNNIAVTTQFRVLVKNGNCASKYSNTVTITVSNNALAGILSSDVIVCASANSGTLSLTGYSGNIVQWESSIDNGGSWSVIVDTLNTYSYSNIAATTQFRVLVKNGNCVSKYSNAVTITVSNNAVAGILSSDLVVCASANSGTLSLTGYTGNIVQWESSIDNGGSWTVIVDTLNTYSYNNIAATTQFRVLVKNGNCVSKYSNAVTITVSNNVVAGTLLSDAVVCASANSGTLSLTGYSGSIVQWESSIDNGDSWSVIADSLNNYSYNNIAVTTQFRVLVKNGNCNSNYSNTVTITVSNNAVAGILSADAVVCAFANNGDLLYSGSSGKIIQWEWYSDSSSNWNVIADTAAIHSYNNLSQTTKYRVLVNNGNCGTHYSNTVTIAVSATVIAGNLSADALVCASTNSGTLFLSGYSGNIAQWEFSSDNSNTWNIISDTINTYSYKNLSSTTQFRVLLKNGKCGTKYSNIVTISTTNPVTKAIAGPDQILCNTNHISLEANNPIDGFGKWFILSGPNSIPFSNDSLNKTYIEGALPGSYQFVWKISNRICPDSKDTVAVIIYPSIKNIIDTLQQLVCKGQSVIINGSSVNNATQYQWEKSFDTVNWFPITNATQLNYSFVPDSSVYIRRSVTVLPCNSVSGITVIKIQDGVSNNTITGNQTICYNSTIQTIKGSTPTGGSVNYAYAWQQSTDNGITWNFIPGATDIDLMIDSPFTKTIHYKRIVTTELCNGPLSNISNSVTITIQPMRTASLQYKGGAYCSLNTSIDFTPIGDGIDSVRLDFGDGSFLSTPRQKISHTYTSAGSFIPAMQIVSSSNTCIISTPVTDTIRIDTLLIGFKLSAVFDCGKTTYRFIDTSSSYFPIVDRKWTINQTPVSVTANNFQQSFALAGSQVTGLQLQTLYGCSNSLDAKFDVGIYQYPKANINAIGLECLNKQVEFQSIVNSVDSIKNRTWNLGNGLTATDSVVKVLYFSEGKYTVKLSVATVNSCYDSAAKQINIHPTPVIALKQDQIICRGDSLQLTAKGADTYIWKDQSDNVICFNCITLTITPKQSTQYKVLGVTTYGCSEIANTNIRVIQPFKMTAKLSDTICIGQSKQIFVNGAANYSWIPAQGISNLNSPSPFVSPVTTTTYKVIGKDNFNCFNDTAQIKITVGTPTPFTIGTDTTILSGVPVQLHALSALQNIIKWQWRGNATFSCLTCPSPTAKVIFDECLNCTATNIYGCTSTDTVCIKTFCPEAEVFIPNAFSPDGDGINDILFVQGRGLKLIKSFRIYNRWGEMVFEKTNFTPGDKQYGWDGRIHGKPATPDVFVYVCEAICERSVPAIFKGNVAIIK